MVEDVIVSVIVIVKTKISPYGSLAETLIAGQMVDGEFIQQKGWRVHEDDRLKVKRTYSGAAGIKPSSTHHYTIEIPEDYPLIIYRRYRTDAETVRPRWEHEILYTPKESNG